MENMETISVSVDADLYEVAKAELTGLQVTPEEYVSLCLTEMAQQRVQLAKLYLEGELQEHLLVCIADTVLNKLMKENYHGNSDH